MTCRGYDSKAVLIKKPIKTLAANILDPHKRGAFIRDYVRAQQANLINTKRRKDQE